MGIHLTRVGDEVLLAQQHPLGGAETARGEQDHARIIGLDGDAEAFGHQAGHQAEQLVLQADALAHIVEPDDLGDRAQLRNQVLKFGLFDEATGAEDFPDPCRIDGRLQIPLAGGEVQHHRHPPEGVQAEEGHNHPHRRRQQDADPLGRLGHGRDLAPENEGRPDQAGVGEGLAVLVLQDFLVAVAGACGDQGVEQGFVACRWVEAGPKQYASPPEGIVAAPSLSGAQTS